MFYWSKCEIISSLTHWGNNYVNHFKNIDVNPDEDLAFLLTYTIGLTHEFEPH